MIKRIIAAFTAFLILTGCGKVGTTTADASEEASESTSVLDENPIYTAFLNNEKKAKLDYTENEDLFVCSDLLFEYEDAEAYNLEDLKRLVIHQSLGSTDASSFHYRHRYIDCGNDGEKELCLYIENEESQQWYAFVLKNEGEELFIRYITWGNDIHGTSVNDQGYIHCFGKGGAGVAVYEQGYLDADARYHIFYECEYYLGLEPGMVGIYDEEVLDNYQILIYSFGNEGNETVMCELYDTRRDDDKVDPDIKNAFIAEGYEFYSRDEINDKLFKRADEIGLDRSLIEGNPADN